LKAKIPFNF